MVRYFAYGSNMSPAQMEQRCPGAKPVGVAVLEGYRLAFTRPSARWGGHAADIVAEADSQTWGVLWEVDEGHLASLDRFEGVASGAYRRLGVTVAAAGSRLDAIAYQVVSPETEGRPSAAYLAVLLEGARAGALPADCVAYLEALAMPTPQD